MKHNLHINKLILKKEDGGIKKLFSPHFGIINGILKRNELDHFNLKMYQSLSSNTSSLFNLKREISSGGLGIDRNDYFALLSCIGESVERYCVSYFNSKTAIFDNYNKLPNKYKICSNFALYSNKQYSELSNNFINPTNDKIYWSKIKGIFNNSEVYWPSSLIFLPFEKQLCVAETTSTGLSAHTDKNKAIWSGLFETIERDSLMISVVNKLPVNEIDLSSEIYTNKFIRKIKKKYNVRIFRLNNDLGLPVFLSLIYNMTKDGVHYGIGASVNFDRYPKIKTLFTPRLVV